MTGVLMRQVLLAGGGLSLLLLFSLGLSLLLPVLAGGWLIGAWWWGVSQTDSVVPRATVRRVSLRVGAVWGAASAAFYGMIAVQPGQVELVGVGLVLGIVAVGAAGALAAMGLTLCGLDAACRLTTTS